MLFGGSVVLLRLDVRYCREWKGREGKSCSLWYKRWVQSI